MTTRIVQDNFSLGLVSPTIYQRTSFAAQRKTLAQADNILCNPQGGIINLPSFMFNEFVTNKLLEITDDIVNKLVYFGTRLLDKTIYTIWGYDKKVMLIPRDYFFNILNDYDKAKIHTFNIKEDFTIDSTIDFVYISYATLLLLKKNTHPIKAIFSLNKSAKVLQCNITKFILGTQPQVSYNKYPFFYHKETLYKIDLNTTEANAFTLTINTGDKKFSLVENELEGGEIELLLGQGIIKSHKAVNDDTTIILKGIIAQKFQLPKEDDISMSNIAGLSVSIYFPVWQNNVPEYQDNFPSTGTFFQNRLWLNGGEEFQLGLFASRSNDPYRFDDYLGTKDDAINFSHITVRKSQKIKYIDTDGSNLLVFADQETLATTSTGIDNVITPQNFSLHSSCYFTLKEGTRPCYMSDNIIFIADRGDKIIAMTNSSDSPQLTSYNLLDIAPEITSEIVDVQCSNIIGGMQGSFLFTSIADGSFYILNTITSQKISSWTRCKMDKVNIVTNRIIVVDEQPLFVQQKNELENYCSFFYIQRNVLGQELLPYFSSFAFLYTKTTLPRYSLEISSKYFIRGQTVLLLYQTLNTNRLIYEIVTIKGTREGKLIISVINKEAVNNLYTVAIPNVVTIHIPQITFLGDEVILFRKKRITTIGALLNFQYSFAKFPEIYEKIYFSNQEVSFSNINSQNKGVATVIINGAFEMQEYPFTITYAGGGNLKIQSIFRDLEIKQEYRQK